MENTLFAQACVYIYTDSNSGFITIDVFTLLYLFNVNVLEHSADFNFTCKRLVSGISEQFCLFQKVTAFAGNRIVHPKSQYVYGIFILSIEFTYLELIKRDKSFDKSLCVCIFLI